MVKSNFDKAEISRRKAYCYTINKMFAILAFSFMSDNVLLQPIKTELYLEVDIHWV